MDVQHENNLPILARHLQDLWTREPKGGDGGGGHGGESSGSGEEGSSLGSTGETGEGSSSSGSSCDSGSPGTPDDPPLDSTPRTITGAGGNIVPIAKASTLPADQRASLYSSSSPASYGYGRPYAGGLYPTYGFWPLGWDTDVPAGQASNNNTRPGGRLVSFGLVPRSSNGSTTFVMFGDWTSAYALYSQLLPDCYAEAVEPPSDLSTNQTVQNYRDDSFALYRFPDSANATYNTTFEACLNNTIGTNILVVDNSTGAASGAGRSVTPIDGLGAPIVLLLVLFASAAASLW